MPLHGTKKNSVLAIVWLDNLMLTHREAVAQDTEKPAA